MEFGSTGKFGLVFRLVSLPAVPPSAAAVQVIPNVGRTDDLHAQSIAHLFYENNHRLAQIKPGCLVKMLETFHQHSLCSAFIYSEW